jgi:hypothetical protein
MTQSIGRGWATIDHERAERQLRDLIADGRRFEDAPRSAVLGARCRRAQAVDGPWIVLLEPDTEGRLTGFLARNGEGWAATWERAGRGSINGSDQPIDGPFGPESLEPGQPTNGPFRLIVTAATIDA